MTVWKPFSELFSVMEKREETFSFQRHEKGRPDERLAASFFEQVVCFLPSEPIGSEIQQSQFLESSPLVA
jgi:hypothetical protein